MAQVRTQIHAGRKIALHYRDEAGRESERTIWPIAVGYLDTVRLLIAWCELRNDFRHFRTDRVIVADFLEERYPERPAKLRAQWRATVTRTPPPDSVTGGGADRAVGARRYFVTVKRATMPSL